MHGIYRRRSSAATVALAVGMAVAAPTPAHAFLGKVLSIVAGEGGGGESACTAGKDWLMDVLRGVVGGPVYVLAGQVIDMVEESIGEQPPCPILESKPLKMEEIAMDTLEEIILQTDELVRMNAPGTVNLGGDAVGGILSAGDQARAVGLEWEPDAADIRWSEQNPESYQGMMPEQMAAHGDQQAMEARDAARTSKRATGAAVQNVVEAMPGEVDTLLAEMAACDGVRCVMEINAQLVGMEIKADALKITMDAAHYRAGESWSDFLFGAREQAEQDRRINDGEIGAPAGPPPPDTMPEPPEPVFDPTVPVS